jgi:D-threo-aldose 1-dehydrogenase
VTRIGLGTAPLGGLFTEVSDDDARRVVESAWEAGIRFFDTAPLYGHGLAEQRLGCVLRDLPREEVTLASKVGRLLRADAPREPGQDFKGVPPVNPVFDFSYEGALRSVEESLERLGLDRLDVVHIHDPDDHFEEALAGAYRAVSQLRDEGAVAAIGVGMNQAEMLVRLAEQADFDYFLVASRYTLLDQTALATLLPLCEARGIAVIVGGVYNSGILADPDRTPWFDYAAATAGWLAKARRIRDVCDRHEVPLKAAALQFPLGHPAVASVLVGPRSVAELEESVRLFEYDIPAKLWDELRAEGLLPEAAPLPTRADRESDTAQATLLSARSPRLTD